MKTFLLYLWRHKLPRIDTIRSLLRRPLSWHGVLVYVLLIGICATAYIGIISFNNKFLVTVPARGGTVVEGVIGAPRLVNPVLASTETDMGLTRLLFSGLMKETTEGTLEPDLAARVDTSNDGRTYTFTLREHLKWSDGKPLTAPDVVFTYNKRALFESDSYWREVSVSSTDAGTIIFTLPTPREDFLSKATLGIIPMHIWGEVPDDAFEANSYNLRPVGSGPFAFVRLRERNGVTTEFIMKRNRHYAHTKAFIDRYRTLFFANQQDLARALVDNDIMITGAALPETAKVFEKTYIVEAIPSTTTIGLLQSNTAILFSPSTLAALNQSIDKQAILDTIDYGYGILPSEHVYSPLESRASLTSLGFNTRADGTLEKNGTPIAFAMATRSDPATLRAAQALGLALQDVGITVAIKAFDPGTFQDSIQHSEYQFIFGTITHQDALRSYSQAIPLYTQSYPLVHDRTLHIPISQALKGPLDRYRESNEWYVRTNKVWKIFAK